MADGKLIFGLQKRHHKALKSPEEVDLEVSMRFCNRLYNYICLFLKLEIKQNLFKLINTYQAIVIDYINIDIHRRLSHA